VPEPAVVLTAGIDVQDDRIEVQLVAWGRGEESWALDYQTFHGSPAESSIWQLLDTYLQTTHTHSSGLSLRISSACIDTGGHHTQATYAWVRPRQGRRIHAVKGINQPGRPIINRPTMSNLGRVKLFPIGVDTAKDTIYGRLKIAEPGPGYMHFPAGFDGEYFKQLTAEQVVTRHHRGFAKREYVKTRPRNEALDTFVYAYAALLILGANLDRMVDAMERKAEAAPPPAPEPIHPLMAQPAVQKGGFVGRWKG
jgi:terminase, large subunit